MPDCPFLWRALNVLPEEYQTVILLRQQMDLTFVEIAERMHRSPEDVRTFWALAILQLGTTLEENE